jgi:RNA polymerase sigma factor for flagellar operon FliA
MTLPPAVGIVTRPVFTANRDLSDVGTTGAQVLVIMETQPTATLSPTNSDFAAHMHLVLSIVADFMRRVPRSVQREDLVAAGSMGLLQALRSNNHTCPEMLIGYARIRIRGAIIDELRRHDWSPRRRRTPASNAAAGVTVVTGEKSEKSEKAGEKSDKPGVVVIGFDDLPPTHSIREEGPSPLEQVEERRSSNEVRNAIAKLPARERTIVTMRYFDEVPSKAIASTLGLSEARISQLLARATSQLKQLLTERPSELDLAA